MTVDQAKLRRLCATPPSSIEVSHARAIAGRVPELLDELDAADQRIADLTAQLAASRDINRHYEQERDSWGAAYKQRAAKTDARIRELEAGLREALGMWRDEVGTAEDDNYDRLEKLLPSEET